MTIDAETVTAGYRILLGREPESDQMIQQHCAVHASPAAFFHEIANSEERRLREQSRDLSQIAMASLLGNPPRVEVEATDHLLSLLLERVQKQWTRFGEEDPYWSVLTHDRFRLDRIDDEAKKEFFASGESAARLLNRFEQATSVSVSKRVCFELGCGVGRITYWLSGIFEKVIAADISRGNLELCRRNLAAMGVTNVEFVLIDDMQCFEDIGEFDLFFSFIVLQHNAPPVQLAILNRLFPRISRGGGALFQVPDQLPGYSFTVSEYLSSPGDAMEMHALPMPAVLRSLRRNQLTLHQVAMDWWTGAYGSYTYFASKQ